MVARTGPKVAVPIRWDDSGRPLKDGLKPASFPVDRPGRTRELLRTLACEGHVEFRSLALFEPAELAPPLQLAPPAGCPPQSTTQAGPDEAPKVTR